MADPGCSVSWLNWLFKQAGRAQAAIKKIVLGASARFFHSSALAGPKTRSGFVIQARPARAAASWHGA
ncbi:hypothetical protein [Polaromonas sp. CG9_12]|nr:hypothetical protein [Polaromonas sp. CG9_12]